MAPKKNVKDSADAEAQPLIQKGASAENPPEVSLRMYLAAFSVCWLLLGVAIGVQVENWSVVTSMYVFVQIVTTIGYGDVTVETELMKLFMSCYVLVSVMLIAGFMTDVAQSFMDTEGAAFVDRLKNVQDKVDGKKVKETSPNNAAVISCVHAGGGFVFFVLLGTVFYATVENCSCSSGVTAIAGCVEGERCADTGGTTKTWIESFYMAVITLTTVGFGDHSPSTQIGRAFGCIWMLFGVVASANFVGAFSKAFLSAKKEQRIGKVSEELFRNIDMDGSGQLSKNEFRMFALQKWGLLSPEQLTAVDSLFNQMDKTGDGYVDFDEVQQYCKD